VGQDRRGTGYFFIERARPRVLEALPYTEAFQSSPGSSPGFVQNVQVVQTRTLFVSAVTAEFAKAGAV
jgi:hypothetical protein